MPRSLEVLVSDVATLLMGVDWPSVPTEAEAVIKLLVNYFRVDAGFLRYNDHQIHATRLIAEWPPRTNLPDPDPLGVVSFDGADTVFSVAETLAEPIVIRPDLTTEDYQRRVEAGTGVPATSMAGVPLLSGNSTTGILGLVKFGDRAWSSREINALKAIGALFAQLQARTVAESKLRYLAEHDPLTGLHNRRALMRYLEQRLAADEPGPVAVLFLDVDHLKSLNDYLGHSAGDGFLRIIADRLRAVAKPEDMIARLGGDEFIVVPAAQTDASEAESLAKLIRDQVMEKVTIGHEVLARTVSVGISVGDPGHDTATVLLDAADQAVHAAKGNGGNTVEVFTEQLLIERELQSDVEIRLKSAIEGDELVLHYLPEVDMRTGEILAMEALVRWNHPNRGLLLPAEFIGVAESLNLAGELDRWVMRRACLEFSGWRRRGVGLATALRINISPAQLTTTHFVESVAAVLAEFGLDGHCVCLEITEHAVVRDLPGARSVIERLKAVGVQVAIDDFGTGYSGLSQLKALPVDILKIDRGFVTSLGTDSGDLAIVKAIAALADSFGLDLVAEGVESEVAVRTLLSLGCIRAQGFLLSRPVPGEQMEKLLTVGSLAVPVLE